jgi:hypothetical protein
MQFRGFKKVWRHILVVQVYSLVRIKNFEQALMSSNCASLMYEISKLPGYVLYYLEIALLLQIPQLFLL